MTLIRWIVWFVVLLHIQILYAEELSVRILDSSGFAMSKVELTVRSLDMVNANPLRSYTDLDGRTPAFRLSSGLYQITATRKGFMNSVKEVFVDDSTEEIVLEMRVRSNIDVIVLKNPDTPSTTRPTNRDEHQVGLKLILNQPPKSPIAGMRILFRDSEGNGQRWIQSDSAGRITIDLPEEPTYVVLPMVVIPIDRKIFIYLLLEDCATPDPLGIYPHGAICVPIKNSSATIEVPVTVSSESVP
ncbi:MAG: hypothetical protein ACLP7O_01960 [Terracidiphilus sp.]